MNNFSYELITRIEFGADVIKSVGEEAKSFGSRALLVYGGGSIRNNGVYDTIIESLQESGIAWREFSGVSPNPVINHAFAGALAAKEFEADVIIAAGGGSVIDESKSIAVGRYLESSEQLWDRFLGKTAVEQAIPIIAVQTMPATSSETNLVSVMTNDRTREKFGLRSPLIAPKVALLDPEVTKTIPMNHTAYGSVDIMAHLLEGYFSSTVFAPVQDNFALGLSSAVKQSLDILMHDPKNHEARSAVMWAGAIAWNGLGASGWEGAMINCHAVEHPLSGIYDMAHGAGLTITIPAYLKVRKDRLSDKILRFGYEVLDLDPRKSFSTEEVIEALESWYCSVGCPVRLSDWKAVSPDAYDFPLLVTEIMKMLEVWTGRVDLDKEDVEKILELMR